MDVFDIVATHVSMKIEKLMNRRIELGGCLFNLQSTHG